MISTFFLTIFYNFFNLLIGFLPVGFIPSDIASSLTYIVGIMNTFNFFFPIGALFLALGISLGFETAVLLFRFVNWIYHKIRG